MCDRAKHSSKEETERLNPHQQGTSKHHKSMENEFFESLQCSKISFFNQSHSKKSDIPPKEQLKILINKKRQTLAALKTLEDEEGNIRSSMKPIKSKLLYKKAQRQDNQEDNKQLIKDLINQSKIFERNIVNKIKSMEDKKKEEQIKQRQEQTKQLALMREERQHKAEEKIRKIKQRQTEREENQKKSIERTKQLHTRSYIFQKYSAVQKSAQKSEKQVMQPIKKHIASIQQILQHEKRYKSLTKQQNHIRKQKILSFRKQFNKRSVKKYPEGRIAGIIKQEKQQQKQKQIEKLAFAERYLNRVSEYGKIVRQLYHPRRRQKTEANQSKGTTGLRREKQTRSAEELKELGDSYLAYNKIHRAKKSLDIDLDHHEPKETKIKYKNYLKELKHHIVSQSFSTKFENIMSEEKSQDRICKLRDLLRDEEIKYPQPSEDKLRELTNAKLAIIDSIL